MMVTHTFVIQSLVPDLPSPSMRLLIPDGVEVLGTFVLEIIVHCSMLRAFGPYSVLRHLTQQ